MARFDEAVFDDLNTPRALAALFETLRDPGLDAPARLAAALSADGVLGLSLGRAAEAGPAEPPDEVRELAERRAEARRERDFALGDELRERIAGMGWQVMDKPGGEWELSPRR
jgi:cysteinyl-tRNA synthetase